MVRRIFPRREQFGSRLGVVALNWSNLTFTRYPLRVLKKKNLIYEQKHME